MQRGWLSILQEEYNTAGKPFMGVVEKTYYRAKDEDGRDILDGPNGPMFRQEGDHMRCGIYPPDYGSKSQLLNSLNPNLFEYALQWEIVGEKGHKNSRCHITDRMATIWADVNFRRNKNDKWVIGDQRDISEIRKAKSVNDNGAAVVIHGCKDGSLGMLVMNKRINRAESRLPAAKAAPKVEERIEEMQKKHEEEIAQLKEDADTKLKEAVAQMQEESEAKLREMVREVVAEAEGKKEDPADSPLETGVVGKDDPVAETKAASDDIVAKTKAASKKTVAKTKAASKKKAASKRKVA